MTAAVIFSVGTLCSCSCLCRSILTLRLSKEAPFQYVWYDSGPASINALVSSKLLTSHCRANSWG